MAKMMAGKVFVDLTAAYDGAATPILRLVPDRHIISEPYHGAHLQAQLHSHHWHLPQKQVMTPKKWCPLGIGIRTSLFFNIYTYDLLSATDCEETSTRRRSSDYALYEGPEDVSGSPISQNM